MAEPLVVEAPGRKRPLARLPRTAGVRHDGQVEQPVVEVDLEWGRRPSGCCICNTPIPGDSTRLVFRVWLREPVVNPNGTKRGVERYYAHPGCVTERVRPEVIRTRTDCYDCGALPPQQAGMGFLSWDARCFTVSKFAYAPLCSTCHIKPRWKRCDACRVYFPHHMISQVAQEREVPVAHLEQYGDLMLREHENVCEYCASRLGVATVDRSRREKADFDRLRREIEEHGVLDAGEVG